MDDGGDIYKVTDIGEMDKIDEMHYFYLLKEIKQVREIR